MSTKQDVIKAYLELGSSKGFDNVSLADIARTVEIKKASLFSHFESFDSLKKSAVDYCLTALENASFDIDFKASSKEKLFDSFLNAYSETFSNFPLNSYLSLLDQKKPFDSLYSQLSHQLNLMICSRLTVALDFSVQHGWSDIKDTDHLAWMLTLCLRDGSEDSSIPFSNL